jgi:hypothetical protein
MHGPTCIFWASLTPLDRSQEVSATPLLDLQSDPALRGYFPGLEEVVIRDYMDADALKPHFGAGTATVAAINCSQVRKTPSWHRCWTNFSLI